MTNEWECEMHMELSKVVTGGELTVSYKRDDYDGNRYVLDAHVRSLPDEHPDDLDTSVTIYVRQGLSLNQVKEFGDLVADLAFTVRHW